MNWSYLGFLKTVFPVAAALFLSACENSYIQSLKRDFGWTEARMTRDGWLEARNIAPPDTWCYGTLAEVECFETPMLSEDSRLVGSFQLQPGI